MNLPPVFRYRAFNQNGTPLAGGKLYTYQAGTSTPQSTYTDQTGATPNTNPIVLDTNGECNLWLDPALSYKFVLQDSNGVTQWTVDNVVGLLTANAVNTSSIQDGAVTSAKLAAGAVNAAALQSDASVDSNRPVSTNNIKDGSVTTTKIAAETFSMGDTRNAGLSATVSANALTVALKTAAGSDATATSPVRIPFRSSLSGTGTPNVRSVSAALSLTVPSGATLGTTSGVASYLWVYALDNAGTVELAISGMRFDEGSIQSTTQMGSSNSASVLYSTTARTNVPVRLIARIKVSEATAGTWASAPTEVSLAPVVDPSGSLSATYTGSTGTSVPQNTVTIINFDTKEIDDLGQVTMSPWKFTALQARRYLVTFQFGFPNTATGSTYYGYIYKNGSQIAGKQVTNDTANPELIGFAREVSLAAGDYIDIRGQTNLAGGATTLAVSTETWVSIVPVP